MTLAAKTTLGPYQVEELIGRGGMGEVYRARDTRLDRDVAIKILPAALADDEERLARFDREAKLLATLSHHHIAGIYGLEEADGTRFLVLELVEGETLAERLARGALPVDETMHLCCQLATGVSSAHERGVLHRDLKPANIKITADDTVKVLDFGIAKAFESSGPSGSLASAPTITGSHHTAAGMVVGTPSYMSPEQARGKMVDKRTDVWSFGCVLYECLTGQMAFGGETATDAIAKILERDPDFSILPANIPPTIQLLLRRCLQKDRKRRLHDMGDARVAIEEAIADPSGTTLGLSTSSLQISTTHRRSRLPWLLCAVLAVVATAAGWQAWRARRSPVLPAVTTHLSLVSANAKINWSRPVFDLSPDGRTLVFVARPLAPEDAPDPPNQLFLRHLDRAHATPIPGTERAMDPRFSPDGEWIAYLTRDTSSRQNQTLKRVRLDGTPPVTIADLADQVFWSTVWLSTKSLLLRGFDGKPRWATISVDGGTPENITPDFSALGEHVGVDIDAILPDGKMALGSVFRRSGQVMRNDAILIALDTWECRPLLENASDPRYAPTGHLVFERDRSLLAAPFDLGSRSVTGSVMPLMSGVGAFEIASSGTLIYYPVTGSISNRQLVTVDAKNNVEPLTPVKRAFREDLIASPDGRWLAVVTYDSGEMPRVWVYEIATGTIRPITPVDAPSFRPCFSPDARHIAFTEWTPEAILIKVKRIDGDEEAREIFKIAIGKGWPTVNCFSADGQHALVQRWQASSSDILRVPFDGGEAVPLLASSANESRACISPGGTTLAYFSNESGEQCLYVRTIDETGAKLGERRRVTTDIGSSSLFWAPNSETLHYVNDHDHLVAVAITLDPEPVISEPLTILDIDSLNAADSDLAALPDGRLVFVRKGPEETESEHINVVLNWFADLTAKVPVD